MYLLRSHFLSMLIAASLHANLLYFMIHVLIYYFSEHGKGRWRFQTKSSQYEAEVFRADGQTDARK
jgi:choline-glycine betaine transporter